MNKYHLECLLCVSRFLYESTQHSLPLHITDPFLCFYFLALFILATVSSEQKTINKRTKIVMLRYIGTNAITEYLRKNFNFFIIDFFEVFSTNRSILSRKKIRGKTSIIKLTNELIRYVFNILAPLSYIRKHILHCIEN